MAIENDVPQAGDTQSHVLEWETPNPSARARSDHPRHGVFLHKPEGKFTTVISGKLDAVMPAHRTYLGYSRRVVLIFCSVVFLVVLVLAIGLGVGLGKGSGFVIHQD